MRLPTTSLALPIALLAPYAGFAAGFEDEPFSLRFPAALTRYSSYGDVAGVGGASAGSPWASSVNPSSVAWSNAAPFTAGAQVSSVAFQEGTRLGVGVASLTFGSDQVGWFLPSVARVQSNREDTAQGLEFEFDLTQVQLQWGRKFGHSLALGITGSLGWSDTEFSSPLGPAAASDDETRNVRFGGLYQPAPRWLLGWVAEFGRTRSDAVLHTPYGPLEVDDVTHQVLLRPGVSFEYAEKSFLYADYQYGEFSNDEGLLVVHRLYAGAEHRVVRWLYPRVGGSYDTRGEFAGTLGVGIYPSESLSIDFAYQHDFFPELDPEFGASRALTFSLALTF